MYSCQLQTKTKYEEQLVSAQRHGSVHVPGTE